MPLRRPVGKLTGPVSARPAGSSVFANATKNVEFSIGNLGFRFAISDERLYQRATAQFRKDQLDSASEPGDQSLTGWWKRGQFAFHKGSGVVYYEVLGSTTLAATPSGGRSVLNRFSASADVTVSVPGAVTLSPAWVIGSPATSDIAWSSSAGAEAIFLTASNDVHTTAGAGSYTPTSGTPVAVAGDTRGNVYVGTTAKKIEVTTTALGGGTVIYTHAQDIRHLWYAKSRLWMIDALNVLYQLAPSPAVVPTAIAAGDKVCTLQEPDDKWFLAEAPATVYFGHASGVVYSVGINTDGSLPTLAAPVEAARLPRGDKLVGLGYYLGFLTIQTASGVRLGVVSADQVTLGPQFLTLAAGNHTRRTITGIGNKVWVSGNSSVVSIDLSEPISDVDLTYAWVTEHEATAVRGVGAYGASLFYAASDGWYHQTTDLSPSGYLTTGQHRFGTLEPKQFANVRVVVGGTAGTVAVSRVNADGSLSSLYTIDVSKDSEADITLSAPDPIINLGLRFDLQRDPGNAANGPTLLGYQLRAFPAPVRQRMVRVPLLLLDTERAGPTRTVGTKGSAWTRLDELEQMERSGGMFSFHDYRTGETGSAYIESVEHEGRTPPGQHDTGFGGVVYLTLRMI